MEIILGSFDLCFPESTQIKQTVKYIFINPEYKPNTRDNNIALLKLAVPIKANSPNIAPICLPTPGKVDQFFLLPKGMQFTDKLNKHLFKLKLKIHTTRLVIMNNSVHTENIISAAT